MSVDMNPRDAWHRHEYERVLRDTHTHDAPSWDNLSDDQKARIREANDEYRRDLDDLATAIRTGGPLPNPFTSRASNDR